MLRLFTLLALILFIPDKMKPVVAVAELKAELKSLPSGSGIELVGDSLYIIGDDSRELYVLDSKTFSIKNRILLVPEYATGRIEKAIKPDLEAMTSRESRNTKTLYLFGSGGIKGYREKLVTVKISDKPEIRTYSLEQFYSSIIARRNLERNQLNIEAAVIHQDTLLLFNRGINFILKVDIDDLIQSSEKKEAPSYSIINCDLEQPNGLHTGFSGATLLDETGNILLTATSELTTNYIQDGKIAGSFISILNINEICEGMKVTLTPIKGIDKKLLLQKIESISVFSKAQEKINAFAVSDNDDGTTNLFQVKIDLK